MIFFIAALEVGVGGRGFPRQVWMKEREREKERERDNENERGGLSFE